MFALRLVVISKLYQVHVSCMTTCFLMTDWDSLPAWQYWFAAKQWMNYDEPTENVILLDKSDVDKK